MKFLGFSTILLIAVLILLTVSVAVQGYVMWSISSQEAYELNTEQKVTTKGVDATEFWKSKKIIMIVPTVTNVLGMALLGLMLAMS